MNQLLEINSSEDIPEDYQDTPIGLFLEYHNLGRPFDVYSQAKLLVGMCMDNRKHLNIPDNFAFIIRAGGANLRYSEFKVSFAVAVGGVSTIALIGHDQCGMVNLASKKDAFVQGLVERGGWDPKEAEEHFLNYCTLYDIGHEVDFVSSEAKRLRVRYPKVLVVPMIYKIEDNRLYLVSEK